jgi:hypothetical protein
LVAIKGRKKMKKQMKNIKPLAISVMLLLSFIAVVFSSQPVQAATSATITGGAPELPEWETTVPEGVTPSVTVETTAFMSVTPNPVGKGQTVLVNLWMEPATHYSRYHSGFTVTITKPDGTVEVAGPINSYQGDATAWFNYVVDQEGNYSFQFNAAANYYPAGYWYNGKVYGSTAEVLEIEPNAAFSSFSGVTYLNSAYYEESESPVTTITVQAEQVSSWPESPLPTDYWTRPIYIEDREWWVIGGQYPFSGLGGGPYWPEDTNTYASNYKFTPYVEAPETAHIVWSRQGALGGIVGGQFGYNSYGPGEGTYAGTPSIVFQGRCYQSVTKAYNGVTQSVWQCYDVRTGEIYWELTGITQPPTVVTYNDVTSSVPGAEQTGQGTNTYSLMYVGTNRLIKYNPWNGAVTLNATLPTFSSSTYYSEPYVLSLQRVGTSYYLINWTTSGGSTNFTTRIQSNITYAFSSLGTCDFESMIAVTVGSITLNGTGHPTGQYVMAASLTTGKLLWNVTTDDVFFSTSTAVADHGKYAIRVLGGWWDCWNLQTGELEWQSETLEYPWGDFGAYTISSGYGMLFDQSYNGIYAINWADGSIAWHFKQEGDSTYETPYGTWSFFTNAMIADGKIYLANGEHSPTQPLTRGWTLFCLNVTSGEEIWNICGGGVTGAIADGYLTFDSRYDGYMYVFGKGQSETTVSAPQLAITAGTSAIISGTVLDMSPAQEGTACVSADSMGAWMEYLHMQKSVPENVTGVPVSIDAVDPNGNYVHIADVTSDMSGSFSYTWIPTIAGDYKITATFMGDDAYGSSWAETFATVEEASETTPSTTAVSFDSINNSLMTIAAGLGVTIIIAVAIATVLILRKRP